MAEELPSSSEQPRASLAEDAPEIRLARDIVTDGARRSFAASDSLPCAAHQALQRDFDTDLAQDTAAEALAKARPAMEEVESARVEGEPTPPLVMPGDHRRSSNRGLRRRSAAGHRCALTAGGSSDFRISSSAVHRPKPLDKLSCHRHSPGMLDVRVIDDPAAAAIALDPVRSRLLSELRAPASAATLADRVGLTRQKINYHLRTLESHGLVRLASEKRWGGLTERRLVATASAYVVSPGALGPAAVDPERSMDRLSASYLIALAARAMREIAGLIRGAEAAGKHLATLSVDTVIRFRSAPERAAFSSELAETIGRLAAKYHDESAPGGRSHRLVCLAHPLPQAPTSAKEPTCL